MLCVNYVPFGWKPALRRTGLTLSMALLPRHGHGQFLAEPIAVIKLAVGCAVFMDQPCNLHIITTILGDVGQPAFAEPTNGLHAFGGLFHPQRRRGYRV